MTYKSKGDKIFNRILLGLALILIFSLVFYTLPALERERKAEIKKAYDNCMLIKSLLHNSRDSLIWFQSYESRSCNNLDTLAINTKEYK